MSTRFLGLHREGESCRLRAMLKRPALLSGALRLAAAGVGVCALTMLLRPGQAERLSEAPAIPQSAAPAASLERPAAGTWSLRSGGWYIQVDGAEVPIPSASEQASACPDRPLPPISPFDRLIERHAKAEGFDWRLIAALIFEESRFQPASRSDRGAYGLMQVRPIAAQAVGAEHFEAPSDNVQTGIRYLRRLDGLFHKAAPHDRLRLVLAAYNVGPGHVRDAQFLARRFGYDPNRWEGNMAVMLPLLEDPTLCEFLPNGYAKGRQALRYVQRILDRFQRYKERAPTADAGTKSPPAAPSANG